jgi:hypothetical protein
VSFFEPSPPAPARQGAHRLPAWAGPPENELGVAVPLRLVLARTEELTLALLDVVAYSTGFGLQLGLRLHPEASLDPGGLLLRQLHGQTGDEQLRFGVEFADGRKATNQAPRRPAGEEELPISLVVRGGRGSSGGLSYDLGYWVFPLPPPGRLTVAVEWLARGLEETRHGLEADSILEAASQSVELWQDNRPVGRRPPPSTGEIRIT